MLHLDDAEGNGLRWFGPQQARAVRRLIGDAFFAMKRRQGKALTSSAGRKLAPRAGRVPSRGENHGAALPHSFRPSEIALAARRR